MRHDVVASPGARGSDGDAPGADDVPVLDLGLDDGGRDPEPHPPEPEPPLVVSRRSARLGAVALVLVGAVIGWAVTSGPDPDDDPGPTAPASTTPDPPTPGVAEELELADRRAAATDAAVTPLRRADRLRGDVGLVATSSAGPDDRPALWMIDGDGRLLARADLPLGRDTDGPPVVISGDNVFLAGDADVYRLPIGLDGYAGVLAEGRRIVPGGRPDRAWLVDDEGSTFASLDTIEAEIGPSFSATEEIGAVWSGVDDGLLVSVADAPADRVSLLTPDGAAHDLGLLTPVDGATVLSTAADLALVRGPDVAVYDLRSRTYAMAPRRLGDVVDGCLSPGGRYAAVVSADGTLTGIEVRTGETWWVADEVPADLGITWTGPDQLVYVDADRLTAIDLPSGNAAGVAMLSTGHDWRLVGSGTTC
ncbi:MAG: hypothetical protein S0880_00485 [Actinomycetota bacterium]|nr:hypothetical protein [Actinomycetota bacterium]